jgi:hypothetical protein
MPRDDAKWLNSFLGVSAVEAMNWAKGGIVFFFAVMITIWLAAVWFLLAVPKPPGLFDWQF